MQFKYPTVGFQSFSSVWLGIVILCSEQSCLHVEVGPFFGLCPPTADALKRFCHSSSCSFSFPSPLSLSLFYLFSPSHLIAFDKCPYWLYIIRCTEGSLRLYYSAHIPHLFSILRGQHTCVCEVQIGPELCQWNSFLSRRFHWKKKVLVIGLDVAYSVTSNLLEGVVVT